MAVVTHLTPGRLEVEFLTLLPEVFYIVKKGRKKTEMPSLHWHWWTSLCQWEKWVGWVCCCALGRRLPLREGLCLSDANQHFVDPQQHRETGIVGKGEPWPWSLFLQAHSPCQQLAGSQLSQLNLQRNVLLFGELPDNTHTLKRFSILAGQQKELPVSRQESHPLQSVLLRCGWCFCAMTVHLPPQWLFPAGFQEWGEQLEKLNVMLHWWREILCTAILGLTACCGHQALSSRRFQGAGKEVECTEALTLEQYKSRRVMQGVCLSCKQWTVCKKGSFMQRWGCGKWETTN